MSFPGTRIPEESSRYKLVARPIIMSAPVGDQRVAAALHWELENVPKERGCCFSQRTADKAFGRKSPNDHIPPDPCRVIFTRKEPPLAGLLFWREQEVLLWSFIPPSLRPVTIQPPVLILVLPFTITERPPLHSCTDLEGRVRVS